MPLDNFIQVNDVGLAIQVTVTQGDNVTPIDLSTASPITIYISRPDNTLISGAASFVTNGKDGKVQYVTQANDLNIQGIYKIQVKYVISGLTKHTVKGEFVVEPNLMGVT